ncbi:MAG: LLM class flavin-dependent oxidoreductase [Acidimicrobiales bacterium]|nr:LLM class flavin-dependent oxidoreductase [Acidimicrobiales bacterium]HRW37858.1 LLM class flavin-dependent oxidoreductase [Aquihabitans sp.]
MPIAFHWFLPTNGDGRRLVEPAMAIPGLAGGQRPASFGYLTQVALAAESFGFLGALTPTGPWCDDAWITTAALAQRTERLKFLVAFRPGAMSPTLSAQMAATYQFHTGGRLLLNVVTGGDDAEQRAYGDHLDKDGRYERCAEFLQIVRGLWTGGSVDFEGRHLHVEGGALGRVPDPIPQVYFGGSSPPALDVAARHVDVYLTWGEPPEAVAEKIGRVRELAEAQGRSVRFGIRLHVVSRDRSADAWAAAEALLDGISDEEIAAVHTRMQRTQSEGQRRMLALHGGSRSQLEVAPNLWAGVGLARGGAGTALVGSHEEVADRIEEYAAIGLDEFVLSGYPHLEELYWFGEGVLPLLEARGAWKRPVGLAEGMRTGTIDAGGVSFGVVPERP